MAKRNKRQRTRGTGTGISQMTFDEKEKSPMVNTTTAGTVPSKPTLFLKPMVWAKILGYARMCPTEISGLGWVDVLPANKGFLISDVCLPPQKGSAAGTEIDAPELGALISQWIMNGENWRHDKLRFWWHSHCDMGKQCLAVA